MASPPAFTPLPTSVSVSPTGSSAGATLAPASTMNALYVANHHATLYCTIAYGVGAQTATLGTSGPSIPPMSWILIEVPPSVTGVAAISTGAGAGPVTFTPCMISY